MTETLILDREDLENNEVKYTLSWNNKTNMIGTVILKDHFTDEELEVEEMKRVEKLFEYYIRCNSLPRKAHNDD